MSAAALLDKAESVLAERAAVYGPATDAMASVAARWSITLGCPITPAQVVLCMIDLKLARLSHNPSHRDSAVDVIGYAAQLSEVIQ